MLTTCTNHTCNIVKGINGKLKPDAIFDYNIAKGGVDLSDQLASYYTLRKTVKWYRKFFIELLLIVNAWYIHQKRGTIYFNLLKFREK